VDHETSSSSLENENAKKIKELCTLMKLQNQQLQWQSQQILTTTSPSPKPQDYQNYKHQQWVTVYEALAIFAIALVTDTTTAD
jgi:hypothetical protein